ncbi:MAG: membrane protein insertion efficiency factor YidD [Candidatus Omnitrophica bacterium]|nr:membrane protein insertion efficiency factor YidD [Candidatus Omnitrophota bacterium]
MLAKLSILLIRVYQGSIRHMMPVACRFNPSCSEFALQAISKYGFYRGGFKAFVRLMHCHPYSGRTGFDPVN